MSQAPATPMPSFNTNQMLDMYAKGQHDQLCEQFLKILQFFRSETFQALNPPSQYFISSFCKIFLFIFSQPDFKVEEKYTTLLIGLNRTISNVVSMSSLKTTDGYLELLRDQPQNFVKILTLYSARNTVKFDRKALFDLMPQLASLWYLEFACVFYAGLASPIVHENMKEHFAFSHPQLVVPHNFQELYFGSTYVDGRCDRPIKEHINRTLQNYVKTLPPIVNKPNKKKVAIVSTSWVPTHSVYRICAKYVESLKGRYHLTHIQPGSYGKQETEWFDDSYVVPTVNGQPDLTRLRDNDYEAVFFPDVGMCAESILLANMRIAPIQICGLGHSVSTWGADVDYFVSGEDCELRDNPEQNYSERLLLLPGMGAIHNRPLYELQHPKKNDETIIINCPWFAQKVNAPFLKTIKKLLDGMKRKVQLRIFVGVSTSGQNDHIPFCREVLRQLGEDRVKIFSHLEYTKYMAMMEEGHLAIDSFHFGGCNTISDNMFLQMPTVTWDWVKWYSMIGSQMLRLVGVEDCIAKTEDEYLNLIWKLVHDDAAREDVRQRIIKADLEKTIYDTGDAKYFADALDYVIANHDRLKKDQDRKAIRIPRR